MTVLFIQAVNDSQSLIVLFIQAVNDSQSLIVLFIQAVNDSQSLMYIAENSLNVSQNEHTSKHPSQTDALYQMRSPSEKRENNFINIGT